MLQEKWLSRLVQGEIWHKMVAQVAVPESSPTITNLDNPLDTLEDQSAEQSNNTALTNAVCQEVLKALKGKSGGFGIGAFAGNSLVASSFMHYDGFSNAFWIVDTGASDHMSSQLHLFTKRRQLKKPIMVRLPDGSTKHVFMIGDITVCSEIILKDVLYVKEFKYNLLSISKLLEDGNLVALFTQKGFML